MYSCKLHVLELCPSRCRRQGYETRCELEAMLEPELMPRLL